MSAPDFLDTNILVYAYDTASPAKRGIAQKLLHGALIGQAMISVQVLSEFSATLLHKIIPALDAEELIVLLDALAPIKTVSPGADTIRRAVQVQAAYKLHFYDSLIVAAAERAGCKRIFSEDLNPGQTYFGVTVENPFADGFQAR